MSEPIVFISHFRVKPGALDAYRQLQHDAARMLEADKPRTLVYVAYLDATGSQLTIVHAFADAESMDLHVEGVEQRSAAAFELLVPEGWEIYGEPSNQVVETVRNLAASFGVTLNVQSEYVGGFLRPAGPFEQ